MKLKKIHLSEDRVLSNDDMKFIIGGGFGDGGRGSGTGGKGSGTGGKDSGTGGKDSGTGGKSSHCTHDGSISDCSACQEVLKQLEEAKKEAESQHGSSMEATAVYYLIVAGMYAYHYFGD